MPRGNGDPGMPAHEVARRMREASRPKPLPWIAAREKLEAELERRRLTLHERATAQTVQRAPTAAAATAARCSDALCRPCEDARDAPKRARFNPHIAVRDRKAHGLCKDCGIEIEPERKALGRLHCAACAAKWAAWQREHDKRRRRRRPAAQVASPNIDEDDALAVMAEAQASK